MSFATACFYQQSSIGSDFSDNPVLVHLIGIEFAVRGGSDVFRARAWVHPKLI